MASEQPRTIIVREGTEVQYPSGYHRRGVFVHGLDVDQVRAAIVTASIGQYVIADTDDHERWIADSLAKLRGIGATDPDPEEVNTVAPCKPKSGKTKPGGR